MKSFITEDSFWELFPQAAVGVVIVEGMKPTAQIPQEDVDAIAALLDRANIDAERHLTSDTISENAPVKAWREAYRLFKTKKGARQIPMSEKVYQALKRAVKNRGKAAPVNIGGYTNFLFLNQSGLPKTASCYESMFQGLVRKYNKHHKPEEALPNITPHTMRHTFCTRLAHAGMNPKDLQYIMGHSNITMTLNYYAHADYTSAKAAMDRLAA